MKLKTENRRYLALSRLSLTALLVTLIRLGNLVQLPYIEREAATQFLNSGTLTGQIFTETLNTFSGRSTQNNIGLLTLGIFPYINASIVIQILTATIPSLASLKKDEGEFGNRKIQDYTRYLTFFWAFIQSILYSYNLRSLIFDWNIVIWMQIALALMTGSILILWFSELITEKGVGNGASVLVGLNIAGNMYDELKTILSAFAKSGFSDSFKIRLTIFGLILIITVYAWHFINSTILKIPVISARQLMRKSTNKDNVVEKALFKTRLPLKINQAGVMPLIFTSSIMVLGSAFGTILKKEVSNLTLSPSLTLFLQSTIFFLISKLLVVVFYTSLIFYFTYFYSTVVLDPSDVAKKLRQNSVIIPGIRPGSDTKDFLNKKIIELSVCNATYLLISILSYESIKLLFYDVSLNSRGFGPSSQIILTGIIFESFKKTFRSEP
jgi:preprotein translocase subunit SecY